jgi:4-alpha-glucanotransferase
MNIPSTVGNNWVWRAMPGVFDKQLAKKIRGKMEIYARLPQ